MDLYPGRPIPAFNAALELPEEFLPIGNGMIGCGALRDGEKRQIAAGAKDNAVLV